MISIAEQTIDYYLKHFKTPTIEDIEIKDKSLTEKQWSIFVTIYLKWEIRWASWNIKEIKKSIAEEIIENTVWAIAKDPRFKPIKLDEKDNIKIRIDNISSRKILQTWEIKEIDPLKSWVLAIKKDYNKMALLLPNINPLLLTWEDLIPVLEKKFNVKTFKEQDYIIYKIKTDSVDNFVSN